MSIPLAGPLVKGWVGTGGIVTANNVENDSTDQTGVLNGSPDLQTALNRLDGTGIGAFIFQFSGAYSATNANINEWFNGRQQVRMRCTATGGITPVTFDLPGTAALESAFATLRTNGLPPMLRLIIEYGADTSFLQILPRSAPSPQITGTTSVVVRQNIAATLEIEGTPTLNPDGSVASWSITDYMFIDISSSTSAGGTLSADAVKLQNPANAVWDASSNGTLPTTGVMKGNAYNVVNAPSDGSGRFGEVMATDDWVVWDADTFTSWSAEPHQWFVLPAHDVRRITALEADYLADFQETPVSNRNTVIRGADYADTAGELRLKIYTAESGANAYTAADLNTTGDIDAYSNPSDITGTLGIRLDNALANQDPPLTDLFVYAENADGTFVLIGNMDRDFAYRGDFGGEADYTSINQVVYTTGQTIRIYQGSTEERYNNPNLDVIFENLSTDVQQRLNTHSGDTTDIEQRLTSLEGKVDNLYPLTPDVTELTEIASVIDTEQTTQEVVVTPGYTLMADYRGDSTRYEQSGVTYDNSGSNVVRYSGLSDDLHRAFGFKVTSPPSQQNTVTLTGASGTANINVDGTDYLATFATDLSTTATNFVTTHASALSTAGITVVASGAVLTFTASTGGVTFTINAPVNVSGDLAGTTSSVDTDEVLLYLVDGSDLTPIIDMTSAGNFRVNNYLRETNDGDVVTNEFHDLTLTSGSATLTPNEANVATYTLTNFPTGSSATQRVFEFNAGFLLNGSDTLAGHEFSIPAPTANTAQARTTIDGTGNLGPLYQNRRIPITISYEYRVSGANLLVDVRLVSAPSDITVQLGSVVTLLDYTAASTTTRTDRWVILTDENGNFVFTGEAELLLHGQPIGDGNILEWVPVVRRSDGTVDQLNDATTVLPHVTFDTVEIPDTIDFRTFEPDTWLRHSELAAIVARTNTQWVYGFATLMAVSELQINEQVGLPQGALLTGTTNNTRAVLSLDDSDTSNLKLVFTEV